MAAADVVAGITAALRGRRASAADVVAVEARKAADGHAAAAPDPRTVAVSRRRRRSPSLTQRRLAELPPDARPLPSVRAYDQLLDRRPRTQPADQASP